MLSRGCLYVISASLFSAFLVYAISMTRGLEKSQARPIASPYESLIQHQESAKERWSLQSIVGTSARRGAVASESPMVEY